MKICGSQRCQSERVRIPPPANWDKSALTRDPALLVCMLWLSLLDMARVVEPATIVHTGTLPSVNESAGANRTLSLIGDDAERTVAGGPNFLC